jgi:4,5-DOPA dioxygenase extradiol
MTRTGFLHLITVTPFLGGTMNLNELKKITDDFKNSARMPLLFVGHGNPMNAIEENVFSRTWEEIGTALPVPSAILSVSAHWLTRGTKVTAMEKPKTIHDFGGFPQKLYEQIYPAPGAPAQAQRLKEMATRYHVMLDYDWGFDHGTWSVLIRMFPKANIPVFQLSIDHTQPMQYHYDLATELQQLRDKGVLVIGSGNIVHNLRAVTFGENKPYDWAIEFDAKMEQWIRDGNHHSIVEFQQLGKLAQLAHPTFDHFIPLLYVLGVQNKKDVPKFFNNEFDMSSVSMRSVIFHQS